MNEEDGKPQRLQPGTSGSWFKNSGGITRGADRSELGGHAGSGGAGRYVYCGNCSPEPLDYTTAVIMHVRAIGWPMQIHGREVSVDVLECPQCGVQVLR